MEVSQGLDLAEVTTPELYLRNAFRLTGLPVDASARRVRRRADEVEAALHLGADLTIGDDWLPSAETGPDAVRDALHRLRDPVRRIVDEFFWLWPGLGGNSLGEAALIWAEHTEADPPDVKSRAIARHNRAVVAHLNALEWPDSGPGGVAKRWRKAYENWHLVLGDDLCWRHLADRITALGDPRLRPGAVERLRGGLPALLLGIHARIAVAAAHAAPDSAVTLHGTVTTRHVKAMRTSGFPATEVDRALVSAVEPYVARLRALGEQSRTASGGAAEMRTAATTLLTASEPDRQVVREVLGADHPVVTGVSDALAARVRECVVREVNALSRDDGDDSVQAMRAAVRRLDKAGRLAAGPHVREEITRDTGTVLANIVIAQCAQALDDCRPAPTSGLHRHRRLLDETRESLRRLEKVGHEGLNTVRDEVAGTAFEMIVSYANATRDAQNAMPALATVRELAFSPQLREQIDRAFSALRLVLASGAPRFQPQYEPLWQPQDPTEDEVLAAIRRLRPDLLGATQAADLYDYDDDYDGYDDYREPFARVVPRHQASTATAVFVGCLLLMAGFLVLPVFPEWGWSTVRYPVIGLGVVAFVAFCVMASRSRYGGRY